MDDSSKAWMRFFREYLEKLTEPKDSYIEDEDDELIGFLEDEDKVIQFFIEKLSTRLPIESLTFLAENEIDKADSGIYDAAIGHAMRLTMTLMHLKNRNTDISTLTEFLLFVGDMLKLTTDDFNRIDAKFALDDCQSDGYRLTHCASVYVKNAKKFDVLRK